jgi:hypothetical protein
MQRFLFLVGLLTIGLSAGCGGGASTGLAGKPSDAEVQQAEQAEKQVEAEEQGPGYKGGKGKKAR